MHESQVPAAALPHDTRALAEALLERVDLAVGHTRLTIDAQDGRVRFITRQERLPASSLERFDKTE